MKTLEQAAGVRLTTRDGTALRTLAGLTAVRLDDLAHLLGADRGQALGLRTTRAVVQRWTRVGLTEQIRPTATHSVIVPTRAGCMWAGAEWNGIPTYAQLPHTLTVAALAVQYIAAGWTWTPEHLLNGYAHRPDGRAARDSAAIAVEAELHQKAARRYDTITDRLLTEGDWQQVHYWCPEPVAQALQRYCAQNLTSEEASRIRIMNLGRWAR